MLFGLFALKFERFTVDFFLKLRNFKLLFIFPNFVYFDLVLVKNFMNLCSSILYPNGLVMESSAFSLSSTTILTTIRTYFTFAT